MSEISAKQSESFIKIFQKAMEDSDPLPYQIQLTIGDPHSSLLGALTGLGKTAYGEQDFAESRESLAGRMDSRDVTQLKSGGVS